MITARVSHVEAYRRWRDDEAATVEELVRWITTDEPSESMKAGTAFHAAIEAAQTGEHETMRANGYTFLMPDAEIALPEIREMRAWHDYGGILVTGQADCVRGRMVIDHKTTGRFDAERYLAGCQWRFYLDIFEADTFQWNVFEIKETGLQEYRVAPPQTLVAYRYPGMGRDCEALAWAYADFAKSHLPARDPEPWELLAHG